MQNSSIFGVIEIGEDLLQRAADLVSHSQAKGMAALAHLLPLNYPVNVGGLSVLVGGAGCFQYFLESGSG